MKSTDCELKKKKIEWNTKKMKNEGWAGKCFIGLLARTGDRSNAIFCKRRYPDRVYRKDIETWLLEKLKMWQ